MSQILPVLEPDRSTPAHADGVKRGGWWHIENEHVICDLCPRRCVLKDGDRGFCFVRKNVGNEMMLTTYGRSTGFCIDPIEKKPLNHFYPGTSVLSFGTAGCNLGCKFCQNWDISKSREIERLSTHALPDAIAYAAKSLGCASVAYTYNDPVIWAEYAIDTARACRALGVKNVAVTAGYITKEARGAFYEFMDAANVDLKAFTEEFYYRITLSHLEPVLETLKWLKAETDVWFEITNLVIPDANDDTDEFRLMCDWILDTIGDEVPVHFTAFHPDFRMRDRSNTPHETLIEAREVALAAGIKYAYVGNVHDTKRQSTYCPNCGKLVIERDCYQLGTYALSSNLCMHCGFSIAGHFADRPGTWGRKRLPVDMRQFSQQQEQSAKQHLMMSEEQGTIAAALEQANITIREQQRRNSHPQRSLPQQKIAFHQQGLEPMVTSAPTQVELTDEQRNLVLAAAAEHVKAAVVNRQPNLPELGGNGFGQEPVSGAFVCLKRNGRLRSCCGLFGHTVPLAQALSEAAHRTATNDPRFPRISPSEVPHLDMEIWLLFALEQVPERGVARIQAVTVGKHGLKVNRGNKQGLLLPGVATDNDWDAEEFLNHVCIKAGIPPTSWKDNETTLLRFEGQVIRGGLVTDQEESTLLQTRPLFDERQMTAYVQFCRETVAALAKGATPLYYCSTVSDENVHGACVIVTPPTGGEELSVWRLSMHQSMPLQSTVFSLCEDLAKTLRRQGRLSGDYQLDLAIAYDSAMHGTVADPELAGVEPQQRAILVSERSKTSWVFDRNKSADELLNEAVQLAQVSEKSFAQIFSMVTLSTKEHIGVASVPRAVRGPTVRPAGVAGKFYPRDPAQMSETLDAMLAGKAQRNTYTACMVPHAGWTYSGQLAADVLKRIKFPKTVIAIGPKHTPHGAEWSVAPHHTWSLPGCSLESDYSLACKLVTAIPGLELDVTAHRQEHGVEVELPIIARLAPQTRVVGVALGAGNLKWCEQFANGLEKVIRQCDEPPLLLISSDMNHFANDKKTRHLDAMALAELDRLDPDALFQTCTNNNISMCGMIPAVIVLKTLKRMNAVQRSHRVGYATSADVTGDTSRVVGYAGRLFQ